MLRRPAVWLLGVAFAAFFALQRLLTVAPATSPAGRQPPPPRVSASPFLNTNSAAEYVGAEACRRCHPDEHRSYLATTHSRSLSLVDSDRPIEHDGHVVHPASRRRFDIHVRDGGLWHREALVAPGGEDVPLSEFPMKYRIGSGKVAHTYAADVDGFLVESPVTWYASQQRWDMSPGFDKPEHSSFQRSVNQDCLYCHAGRVTAAASSRERLQIHELAISCERCHGPGSIHVQRHEGTPAVRDGPTSPALDDSIVNPARLSRELNEAICQQCHLLGDARVVARGQQAENYRPGLPLNEFRLEYRLAGSDDDEMTVVGHVEQMHLSRCYQASDTFTCTTCHDPHNTPDKDQRIGYFNSKCQACHDTTDCTFPANERIASQDNCLSCHMPSVPTDVPHVAFTQHRVGIHTRRVAAQGVAKRRLVPIQPLPETSEAEQERTLGLAYWNLYSQHLSDDSFREGLNEAFAHLERSYESGINDPEVLSALAAIALGTGNVPQAEELCRAALAGPVSGGLRADLQAGLAMTLFRQQRYREAGELYQQITLLRRDASDWYMQGLCFEHLDQPQRALAAYEKALNIDPSSALIRRQARDLYVLLQDGQNARRQTSILERLPGKTGTGTDDGPRLPDDSP